MQKLTTVQLRAPYLILIGDLCDPTYAKTGFGLVHWRPELVTGQLRFPGCGIDMGVPDMSVAQAKEAGVRIGEDHLRLLLHEYAWGSNGHSIDREG